MSEVKKYIHIPAIIQLKQRCESGNTDVPSAIEIPADLSSRGRREAIDYFKGNLLHTYRNVYSGAKEVDVILRGEKAKTVELTLFDFNRHF